MTKFTHWLVQLPHHKEIPVSISSCCLDISVGFMVLLQLLPELKTCLQGVVSGIQSAIDAVTAHEVAPAPPHNDPCSRNISLWTRSDVEGTSVEVRLIGMHPLTALSRCQDVKQMAVSLVSFLCDESGCKWLI